MCSYIDEENLNVLKKKYGDTFYILDLDMYKNNYEKLIDLFQEYYKKFNIAYSYKTNYMPSICRMVNKLGGYAEVVSEMEYELAMKLGVSNNKVILNGPYKNIDVVIAILDGGGIVNVDSIDDLNTILEKTKNQAKSKKYKIGIRCNFDIEDGIISRFGFDVDSVEFDDAISLIKKKFDFIGLHCHFASRDLFSWKNKVSGLKKLLEKYFSVTPPKYIDIGGGLFGNMPNDLKHQFNVNIPSFKDYASEIAPMFNDLYGDLSYDNQPNVFIEPGSALVGDVMSFVSSVYSIKNIRGTNIVTLTGSIYNINPTLNKKNPPIRVINNSATAQYYSLLDFGGYTCIESDYMYRGYSGKISKGDTVVFGNVGSYSIVLKPPFILPNYPIVVFYDGEYKLAKRKETFEDLFNIYFEIDE